MNVPHFFQSTEANCGPSCLRMIASALGIAVDESVVAQHCNATPLGCTVHDLVDGARALGLIGQVVPIHSEADAIQCLSNQLPIIAMIDLSELHGGPMFQWHFVVALSVSQGEAVFHDPADGPDRRASLEDFLTAWRGAAYRGVKIWTP